MKYFLIQFAQKLTPDEVGVPPLSGDQILQNGLNIMYAIMAIIAVIVVIIGGLMYASSAGNAPSIIKAKGMILYSIVGIIVILSAFAITNFIFGRF